MGLLTKSGLRRCLLAVVLLAQTPAFADTLFEESRAALTDSPALGAERARLDASRQSLPLAWSEALPTMLVQGDAVEQDQSEPQFVSTVRQRPEYWIASVRTSQLLFGSGRVLSSTRQARAQVIGAVARYQDAAQTLVLDLTRAYGQVRYTHEAVAAQEELLSNLEHQAEFARANRREGFLTNTDVAQADARVALARAQLADARAQVIEANETYMRITGHPPTDLQPPPSLSDLPADLETAFDLANAENPTIIAASADVDRSSAAVLSAASEGLPRVDFQTNYGRFDVIGGDIPSHEQWENSASVRVTIPLLAGGAVYARTQQQRALRRAARYDLVETQRRVHERVAIAWANLISAREGLTASRVRLDAAELASRGTRLEQQYGQRSMIDVLDQEQELISARIALARGERDAMIAERVLMATTGQLGKILEQPAPPPPASRTPPRHHRSR